MSVAGARRNLEAGGSPSFARMRTAATRAWDARLGQAKVTGGSATNRKLFSTALYHTQVMPNVFSDADGRYRGMDGKVHTAKGFTKYANISGWDTYRSQLPLMAMLDPEATSDFARSMLADERQSGALPKWALREGQTNVMVGDPADLLLSGAWAYGARGFDAQRALRAMVRGATKAFTSPNGGYVQRAGLADYLDKGYVGYEQNTDSAGQTLRRPGLGGRGRRRSSTRSPTSGSPGWRAPSAMRRRAGSSPRARGTGGTCSTRGSAAWRRATPPTARSSRTSGRTSEQGFVEGSAAQYTWFVPHDVAGLIGKLGGRAAARRKLDAFFGRLNAGVNSEHAFLGNEPTLFTPYLYDWLGRPSSGARVMRRAMSSLYRATPGGFPGNDDGGAMSAWWVFGALGLSPTVPGTGVMTLSSPLFTRAAEARPRDARHPRSARGGRTALRARRDARVQGAEAHVGEVEPDRARRLAALRRLLEREVRVGDGRRGGPAVLRRGAGLPGTLRKALRSREGGPLTGRPDGRPAVRPRRGSGGSRARAGASR